MELSLKTVMALLQAKLFVKRFLHVGSLVLFVSISGLRWQWKAVVSGVLFESLDGWCELSDYTVVVTSAMLKYKSELYLKTVMDF